jgi:hypothetical protein
VALPLQPKRSRKKRRRKKPKWEVAVIFSEEEETVAVVVIIKGTKIPHHQPKKKIQIFATVDHAFQTPSVVFCKIS